MYLSDMHTHSIASGHGTICTISDMAKSAEQKGLKLLGITDHGPATLCAGTPSYFRSLTFSPKKRFHVEILYGVELNILDTEGTIDLDEELLSRLDYAIASMHAQNYRTGTREENTKAYINVMKHPCVKILGHCDNPHFPADYEALAIAAKKAELLLKSTKLLSPHMDTGEIPERTTEKFFTGLESMKCLSFYQATATGQSMLEILLTQKNLFITNYFRKN